MRGGNRCTLAKWPPAAPARSSPPSLPPPFDPAAAPCSSFNKAAFLLALALSGHWGSVPLLPIALYAGCVLPLAIGCPWASLFGGGGRAGGKKVE